MPANTEIVFTLTHNCFPLIDARLYCLDFARSAGSCQVLALCFFSPRKMVNIKSLDPNMKNYLLSLGFDLWGSNIASPPYICPSSAVTDNCSLYCIIICLECTVTVRGMLNFLGYFLLLSPHSKTKPWLVQRSKQRHHMPCSSFWVDMQRSHNLKNRRTTINLHVI